MPLSDQLTSAEDTCQEIWPSDRSIRIEGDHRQHRCGRNRQHRGRHVCCYCGTGAR